MDGPGRCDDKGTSGWGKKAALEAFEMKFTKTHFRVLALLCMAFAGSIGGAQDAAKKSEVRDYLKQPDAWFHGAEAAQVAKNILSYQSPLGGWPKNLNTAAETYRGAAADLHPTFDNGATTGELRFVARIYNATHEKGYQEAFSRGLDYILKAQYPTGGWPQSYPPDDAYHRYITFNDDAMVRLMGFLREVSREKAYDFVDAARRDAARQSFERGVACILKCQIKVGGKLTVWCAQHDEKDYSPRPARKFEPASLSGSESVGITRLLMSLDNPGPEVVNAVQSAMEWFAAAKLTGIRLEKRADKTAPKGYDTVVVNDAQAPPLWARFYEIGTNKPIFCDRDSVIKYSLAEIGYERRNGYAWMREWAASLLSKEYPAWQTKWAAQK